MSIIDRIFGTHKKDKRQLPASQTEHSSGRVSPIRKLIEEATVKREERYPVSTLARAANEFDDQISHEADLSLTEAQIATYIQTGRYPLPPDKIIENIIAQRARHAFINFRTITEAPFLLYVCTTTGAIVDTQYAPSSDLEQDIPNTTPFKVKVKMTFEDKNGKGMTPVVKQIERISNFNDETLSLKAQQKLRSSFASLQSQLS